MGAFLFAVRLRGRLFKRLWSALGEAAAISCILDLDLRADLLAKLVVSGVIKRVRAGKTKGNVTIDNDDICVPPRREKALECLGSSKVPKI